MKRKIYRIVFSSLCDETGPEDGIDPRYEFKPNERKPNRKGLQLCRQIERAIEHALSWELGDALLSQLRVDSVQPAPHTRRVAIFVSLDATLADRREEAEAALAKASGRLRSAAATAINRRRVPEVAFVLSVRS